MNKLIDNYFLKSIKSSLAEQSEITNYSKKYVKVTRKLGIRQQLILVIIFGF